MYLIVNSTSEKNDKKLIALKVSAGAVLNQSRSAALLQKHSLYFCDRNGDYLLEIPTQPVERGPLKISIIFGIIGKYSERPFLTVEKAKSISRNIMTIQIHSREPSIGIVTKRPAILLMIARFSI